MRGERGISDLPTRTYDDGAWHVGPLQWRPKAGRGADLRRGVPSAKNAEFELELRHLDHEELVIAKSYEIRIRRVSDVRLDLAGRIGRSHQWVASPISAQKVQRLRQHQTQNARVNQDGLPP